MKHPLGTKVEGPRYPTPLSVEEAEHNLEEIQYLIDVKANVRPRRRRLEA
jgi:hypothetical protein